MKKSLTKIIIATLIAATMTSSVFAAKAKKPKAKKILVAVGNAYKPYCYIDEKGKLAGYEYEVLSAIDELLPQYEFEYEPTQFTSLFSGLSQKKYDAIAQQIEYNPDRYERYEFTKETYTTFITYITVLKETQGINSLEDLSGKTAYISNGDNSLWYLEDFNKKHPGKEIKIETGNLSTDERMAGLKSHRWDFTVSTKRDVESRNKEYGDILKITGKPVQTSSTYFLFQKGNTELRDAFDGAIRELKKSGKLREISIAVIGGDYTESE